MLAGWPVGLPVSGRPACSGQRRVRIVRSVTLRGARRPHALLAVALLLAVLLVACAPSAGAGAALVGPAEAARIAAEARWAPGQREAHFERHPEGYRTVEEYDQGARETIRVGRPFTYRDRTTGEPRLGFYDPATNRFTAVTRDGRRITTHFRPDRGEAYVRGLPESSYRSADER